MRVKICKKGKEDTCLVTYMFQKEKRSATFTIVMLLIYCCTRALSSIPVLQNLVLDDQMLSILQLADIIAKRIECAFFEISNTDNLPAASPQRRPGK